MDLLTTAFIVAGGRSTRMGTDKAFLRLGRMTLLEHAILTAKKVCGTVVLAGDKKRLSPYGIVIEDIFTGRGPLGAIHAGLSSSFTTALNLFLAVDTPAIPAEFLRCLFKIAGESDAVVTVPRAKGFVQPLCAVYRKEFANIAEKSLRAGQNKIDPLFAKVPARIVEESELNPLGLTADIFHNVNTPEDWERLQQQAGTGNG